MTVTLKIWQGTGQPRRDQDYLKTVGEVSRRYLARGLE